MPDYGGKHYRTHSQGARAMKEQGTSESLAAPKDEPMADKKMEGGSVTHIKHHEDGTHSVKHADGEMQKNVPMHEVTAKLEEKHGGEEYPDDSHMDSDYGREGSSEAIKTLLG
jgi:hypothetical protein